MLHSAGDRRRLNLLLLIAMSCCGCTCVMACMSVAFALQRSAVQSSAVQCKRELVSSVDGVSCKVYGLDGRQGATGTGGARG